MNPDLTQLLRQAADEPSTGPDLARIATEVHRRRRRKRGVTVVTVALTVAALVMFAPHQITSPPVADPMPNMDVALLDRDPTTADSAIEDAVNRSWALDRGSVRLWGEVGDFQYGVATAHSGSQICILKMEKGPNSSIGLVGCGNTTRLTDEGVFAMATNSVPDHMQSHSHIAVLVPNGYREATYDNLEVQVEGNMFVISSPPYPTEVTLRGPLGQRTVALPSMPNAGDAPRTG